MKVNYFHLKSQSEDEIEQLESRVSTCFITDEIGCPNSNLQLDCGELREHRERNDIKAVVGCRSHHMGELEGGGTELPENAREGNDEIRVFMRQELAETEECHTESLPQYKGDETDENSIFESQQMHKPEECDIELPQHKSEVDDVHRDFLSEQMAKTEEWDAKLLPQNTGEENDGNSDFMCQQMADPQECDAELPPCTREENDETGFMSQVIQQMDNTEEGVTKLPQHTREGNEEKSDFVGLQMEKPEDFDFDLPQLIGEESDGKRESNTCHQNRGKYFYYDTPLSEETGVWIPVSVPPMSESEHKEWSRGFCSNGGYFPEGDMGWSQYAGEDKELTMWDVLVEMLFVARGKVRALASGDIRMISWISSHLIEQAWKEMAQTLTEANFNNTLEIIETEPPKWLPDSAASACMLCSVRFHPFMCTRHHCRFCGGIFCSECTKGRSLLPSKFRVVDPQRVCDVCFVRLESVQPYLMDQVSRAAQLPTHDLTDLSTLRSWLNFPWGQSMEYEIYKATNTIRGYNRVGSLKPEKSIPNAILRQAKGLAIITIVKVGMMVTYNIGTGLVVARREDGSWSPPSALSSFGVGWGAQAGGELIDLIIVLRTNDAVKTFSGEVHLSIGAGLSAAVGIVGRTAEADVRAGTGGYSACYTYSCSKGAFVGCSLEGSIVTTRTRENSRFYGSQSINAPDILLGSLPRPPAAAILYRALADLYQKLEV